MNREPVSDERLEELIGNVKDDAKKWEFDWRTVRGADEEYGKQHEETQREIADKLSLLTELKSRRAQQARERDRQAAIFDEMRKEVESEQDGAVLSPEGAKRFSELLAASADERRQKPQMLPEYAQQAEPPAGCAEMATTIEKAIADGGREEVESE